jgi:Zn-dependent M28 family amino/carboxypeptidase
VIRHPLIAGLAAAWLCALSSPALACATLVDPPGTGDQWLGCIDPYFAQAMTDVEILSADDMQGRAPSTAGSAKARAYIVERLTALGVSPFFPAGFEHPFEYEGEEDDDLQGANVVAVIPGTASDGKIIVVTAHYDHLGTTRRGIFNGADDNASGVAAMLAFAAQLKAEAPSHTVILAFTDAEEIGFNGSAELVDDDNFPLSSVAFNLNLDMISKGTNNELFAMGGAINPSVKALIDSLPIVAPVKLVQAHDDPDSDTYQDWTNESDQISFHREDIAWLYFANEEHAEYHEPTDDFATVQPEFFKASLATALAALRLADRSLASIASPDDADEDDD